MATFTERLKYLQANSGMKKDVAASIGISVMTYYRYETGQHEPTMNILIRIADYFNVSLDYLVGRSVNPRIM